MKKISNKYLYILHGDKKLNEKCVRCFASKDSNDGGLVKINATTERPEKIENTPENCFLFNSEVNDVKVPRNLNKQWYIDLTYKRLNDFGLR